MAAVDSIGLVLHGGRSDTSKVFGDLFVLSHGGVVPLWSEVGVANLPARYSHALCRAGTGSHVLLLHGGKDENHEASAALWLLDVATREASRPTILGEAPSARYFHSLVAIGADRVVCFGGMGATDRGLNDVHVLDLSDRNAPVWSKPEVFGTAPSPRWNASVWCKDSQLCVFGGCGEMGQNTDMFVLDTKLWLWTEAEPKGDIPPATQKYRQTLCGTRVICVGEKGPLRLYYLDHSKPKPCWESYKATGALPSLSSFALCEGGGTLFLAGGKPFVGKESEIALWMLDLAFFSAHVATVTPINISQLSSIGGGHKEKEKDKHKYGTLRSMFRRKSVTEPKSVLDELNAEAVAGVELEVSSSSSGAVSPSALSGSVPNSPSSKSSRKTSRLSKVETAQVEPPKSPHTLRRNDSVSRFAPEEALKLGALASPMTARSPAVSPGRSQKEAEQDDVLHLNLAEATVTVEKLRKELDLERKKSAALCEEVEKVSGKGNASVLVRKALEDEVKRSAMLSAKVEVLEKDLATLQHEKQMMANQAVRLKAIISDQGKTIAEADSKIAVQAETLKDSNATISRLEIKVGQTKALSKRAEDERVDRTLAELKLRRKEQVAKELMGLLAFVRGELHDLAAAHVAQIADPVERERAAVRFSASEDLLKLYQDPLAAHVVAGPPLQVSAADKSGDSDGDMLGGGSDSQESDSHSPRSSVIHSVPKLLLQTMSNPSSGMPSPSMSASPKLTASPKLSSPKVAAGTVSPTSASSGPDTDLKRHLSLLQDLEYRNTLECPLSFPAPTHELVNELRVVMQRFRVRLGATQGDCRAIIQLVCEIEETFLENLTLLETRVCVPLQDTGILTAEALQQVFGNLSDLKLFQEELVEGLKSASEDASLFVALYSEAARSMLDLHDLYAENLTMGLSRLELFRSRSARLQMFLLLLRQEQPRILDVRSLLIKPLIHLACLAESFAALAGCTHGYDDNATLVESAATVFRILAVPVEMLHEKLALTCSNAKLRQFEMMLSCSSEDPVDLIGGIGRMLVDDGEFVLVESSNGVREAYAVTTVLCNDILLLVKKATARAGRLMLLHELFPLSVLQMATVSGTSTPTRTGDVISFSSKARSGVVYSLHAASTSQAKYWEELLRSLSEAAFAFYHEKTQSRENAVGGSLSGSGFLAAADIAAVAAPAALVDSDDIVYTKDATSGRVTVRGGKPEALVKWLIHDISGAGAGEEVLQFLQSIAVCGNRVVSAEVISSTSISLFKSATTLMEQYRVLNFLSLWVQEFGSRDVIDAIPCTASVFRKLFRFVEKLSQKPEFCERMNPIKLGFLRAASDHESANLAKSQPKMPRIELETADLEEIQPGQFAEQLTLYAHSLLAALTDDDLYQGDKAPRVASMIQFWNELSEWCATYLGQPADDVATAWRLRRLLAIAKRCVELNNYDSAFAMGLALDSSRVSRTAVENVGTRGQEVIDLLNYITNVTRGFSNYRTLTESLEPPAVPYLAIALKDVVLIRENDNFIEKTQLLNYRKLVILGSRLRFLRRYRQVPYGIKPIGAVQAALRALPGATQMMKTRPPGSAPMPPTAAQQLDVRTSTKSQRKKSVFSGTTFFSPRDGSASPNSKRTMSARTLKKGMLSGGGGGGDEDGVARRTASAAVVVVLPPDPAAVAALSAASASASASASSTASPAISSPSSPQMQHATQVPQGPLSVSEDANALPSRWSRALPRSSGVNSTLGRQRSGDLNVVSDMVAFTAANAAPMAVGDVDGDDATAEEATTLKETIDSKAGGGEATYGTDEEEEDGENEEVTESDTSSAKEPERSKTQTATIM